MLVRITVQSLITFTASFVKKYVYHTIHANGDWGCHFCLTQTSSEQKFRSSTRWKTTVHQQTFVMILILAQLYLVCNVKCLPQSLCSNIFMWCVMAYVTKGTYMIMKTHFCSLICTPVEPGVCERSLNHSLPKWQQTQDHLITHSFHLIAYFQLKI